MKRRHHKVIQGCAGNGKTREVTEIVAYHLSKGRRVMCISFTCNAADELMERLVDSNPEDLPDDLLVITTMHSWLTKIMIDLSGKPAVALQTVIQEGLDFIRAFPDVVREAFKFDVIVVDEAQDLSEQQFEVVMALSKVWEHARYIVVGDVAQSIFGFQGARPDLLLDLPDRLKQEPDSECEIVVRNINHRCSAPIIAAANANLANMTSQHKIQHHLMEASPTASDHDPLPILMVSKDRASAIMNIHSLILNIITRHSTADYSPSIVVLHRTQRGLREIARVLLQSIDVELMLNLDDAPIGGKSTALVQLRTIHGSKGGTWDFVIIAGMTDRDGLPSERSVKEGQSSEEQRLFHVALTRARYQCIISANAKDKVSRFIPLRDAERCYSIHSGVDQPISSMKAVQGLFAAVEASDQIPIQIPSSIDIVPEWQKMLGQLHGAIYPESLIAGARLQQSASGIARIVRQCIQVQCHDSDVFTNLLQLLKDIICNIQTCVEADHIKIGRIDTRLFHHARDVRALQKQSLLLLGSVFMSDMKDEARRVPSEWLQEAVLPGVTNRDIENQRVDIVHIHNRHHEISTTLGLRNHLSKRPRLTHEEDNNAPNGEMQKYANILHRHGLSLDDYRPFCRDWDTNKCAADCIRSNIMHAWGQLLEPREIQSFRDLLYASLKTSLRQHPVVAVRVTAPESSTGKVRLSSLVDDMMPNVVTVNSIISEAEKKVSSKKGRTVHMIVDHTPDAISIMAHIIAMRTKQPAVELTEFTMALTPPVDCSPSVYTCAVSAHLQELVSTLLHTVNEHKNVG